MGFNSSFTAKGQSSSIVKIQPGESISYDLTVATAEAFIGNVQFLAGKHANGLSQVYSHTGTAGTPIDENTPVSKTFINNGTVPLFAKLVCVDFDTDTPSDAIAYVLTEGSSDTILEAVLKQGKIQNRKGQTLLEVKEDGIQLIPGILAAELYTTAGGAAEEVVTVPGAKVTDLVLATINTAGGTPVTLDAASVTDADEVTLTFSDDPDDDHIVNLIVIRGAA